MAYLLEVRNITKNFGAVRALDKVSLEVGEGEVVALLGDNGAGKSTLVKIIGGYHSPDSGEIIWKGEKVKFKSVKEAHDAGCEVVYQHLALVPLMSVWRNFFLGREIRKSIGPFEILDKQKMRIITKESLLDLGIKVPSIERPVSFLSGGQRQAIAVGRGVHFGARLLILDEPTAAVSVKETEAILQLIEDVSKRGIGVIFVSHNIYHAYRVANHFIILSLGKKMADIRKDDNVSAEDIIKIIATAS